MIYDIDTLIENFMPDDRIFSTEKPPFMASKNTPKSKEKLKSKEKKQYLSQRFVDRAKPKDKEYTIYDKFFSGFGLRVRPTGHMSFVIVYKKDGKVIRIVIGEPSTMTYEQASNKAYDLLQNIREHGDPNGQTFRGNKWTLPEVFEKYIEDHGKRLSIVWRKQSQQLFYDYVEPYFKDKMITDISRGDLLRCIKLQDSLHIQRHIQSVLSSMYSWAVDLEFVGSNVIIGTKLPKVESRDRFLTELELASVYHASFKLQSPFGACGRFLTMSGQRRGEVANMTWGELDLEQKIWTLPKGRSKNRHQHTVPLTDAMIELLNTLPRTSDYVFESPVNKGHPINSFSKMAYHWQKHTWVENWRVHDLRRSLASGMARLGIAPHVIEAVLNHRSGVVSGIAAVYNRYRYEKEKREALDLWQAHLAAIAEQHKDYQPPQLMPKNPDDEVEL